MLSKRNRKEKGKASKGTVGSGVPAAAIQRFLLAPIPKKNKVKQCVRDGLSNTKANPVPGSPDLLYHLHSLHFTGQLFSLILFLLFTHATVWKEAALYRARVTERDGFPRA